jgi:hypothetical protein
MLPNRHPYGQPLALTFRSPAPSPHVPSPFTPFFWGEVGVGVQRLPRPWGPAPSPGGTRAPPGHLTNHPSQLPDGGVRLPTRHPMLDCARSSPSQQERELQIGLLLGAPAQLPAPVPAQAPRGVWEGMWERPAIWQKREPYQCPGTDGASAARRRSAVLEASLRTVPSVRAVQKSNNRGEMSAIVTHREIGSFWLRSPVVPRRSIFQRYFP